MRKETRKKNIYRNSPCICCGFPLTHSHHLLPFSIHGETNIKEPLCPNHHELLHLMFKVKDTPTEYNQRLLNHIQRELGKTESWKKLVMFFYANVDYIEEQFFERIKNE